MKVLLCSVLCAILGGVIENVWKYWWRGSLTSRSASSRQLQWTVARPAVYVGEGCSMPMMVASCRCTVGALRCTDYYMSARYLTYTCSRRCRNRPRSCDFLGISTPHIGGVELSGPQHSL